MKSLFVLVFLSISLSALANVKKYCGRYHVYAGAGANSGVIDNRFDPVITGETVIAPEIRNEQWPQAGDCTCVYGVITERSVENEGSVSKWHEFVKVTKFLPRPAEACKDIE